MNLEVAGVYSYEGQESSPADPRYATSCHPSKMNNRQVFGSLIYREKNSEAGYYPSLRRRTPQLWDG